MLRQQQEWRKSFENKTEYDLAGMAPPPGLPTLFVNMWRRDREEALARLQAQTGEPELTDQEVAEEEQSPFSRQRDALEAAMSALEHDTPQEEVSARVLPSQSLEIPKGNAADLLERQIGTCAALIGNVANHIARNDTPNEVCFPFMDRIASLLSSSATAARVVGQLRGIASETKQTFITEKGGKGAGEVPQT